MATPIDAILRPQTGVDRVELNIIGRWPREARKALKALDHESVRLKGKAVRITNGGRHGPDFCPLSINQPTRFRIDPFFEHKSQFAGRVYLYAGLLAEHGFRNSMKMIRDYLERLGCHSDSEQLSRIDLCVDIAEPIEDFLQRVDDRWYVCRLKLRYGNDEKYPTTRCLGSKSNFELSVYDKSAQLDLPEPLTRVEFRLGRKYLAKCGIEAPRTLDIPKCWKELTGKKLRLTDRRPDANQQSRCPTWEVWEAIQQARWSDRDILAQKRRRPKRKKRRPHRLDECPSPGA